MYNCREGVNTMKKSYNGRFSIPKKPESGTGWLVLGILLMFGGFPGVVLGCLSLYKYSKCRSKYKLYERFMEYCAVIGMRSRIGIRELARAHDRSESDTRRDLQSMIAKGYFGKNAYLDIDCGCLILSDEAVSNENWKDSVLDLLHFIEAEFSVNEPVQDAAYEPVQKESAPQEPAQSETVHKPDAPKSVKRTYMEELERTLNELYQLNKQIEDEGVSKRIDRIGELTGGIFRAVIENPNREPEVRKFMNYYLPTTLKLLKSYDLMESQSYQGENIVASRRKIENVLDLLIEAYEKQLDRLFGNDALDIAADIDVLETMMAGDGLSSKGTLKI